MCLFHFILSTILDIRGLAQTLTRMIENKSTYLQQQQQPILLQLKHHHQQHTTKQQQQQKQQHQQQQTTTSATAAAATAAAADAAAAATAAAAASATVTEVQILKRKSQTSPAAHSSAPSKARQPKRTDRRTRPPKARSTGYPKCFWNHAWSTKPGDGIVNQTSSPSGSLEL